MTCLTAGELFSLCSCSSFLTASVASRLLEQVLSSPIPSNLSRLRGWDGWHGSSIQDLARVEADIPASPHAHHALQWRLRTAHCHLRIAGWTTLVYVLAVNMRPDASRSNQRVSSRSISLAVDV